MAVSQSERTKKLIGGFMDLHNDGKTIKEIANHYNLSVWTVYNNLQTIADNNGVARDTLLEKVHKHHELKHSTNPKHEPIDIEKLHQNFSDIHDNVSNIIESIEKVLKEEKYICQDSMEK